MKLSNILICILTGVTAVGSAYYAAKPKTIEEWEQCRDKVDSAVSQLEIGVVGVEAEIKMKCGESPAKEPNSLTGAVGMHPYDLVRSKAWKSKFVEIAKDKYEALIERLDVSSGTTFEGNPIVGHWIVGDGQAPHMGGTEEAALAINAKTGEVFAAMMEDGNKFSTFGFDSWQDAPPYLQKWLRGNKK